MKLGESIDFPRIPHYYGDAVRQFLLGATVLMLGASPFYADSLQAEMPIEIVAAIIILSIAALTNPRDIRIMIGGAVVSGIGGGVYGLWALSGFEAGTSLAFVLRLAISLVFFAGFYFSMKTVRAMLLHQVGKEEEEDEFMETESKSAEKEIVLENAGEAEPYEEDEASKEETISGD